MAQSELKPPKGPSFMQSSSIFNSGSLATKESTYQLVFRPPIVPAPPRHRVPRWQQPEAEAKDGFSPWKDRHHSLTFALVCGLVQDGLGGDNLAISKGKEDAK